MPLITTNIDAGDLYPGDCVSCNQLESNMPKMMTTWKDKPTTKAYKASTIFVDHASRFVHLTMCESTRGEEALQAKLHFEKLARTEESR